MRDLQEDTINITIRSIVHEVVINDPGVDQEPEAERHLRDPRALATVTFWLQAVRYDGSVYRQEWVEKVEAPLGYLGEPSVAEAAIRQLQRHLSFFTKAAGEIPTLSSKERRSSVSISGTEFED